MFYYLFSILILIACILLVLVVLVQNPKGGGLASAFAGSNQVMGVRKTADFLEKATWVLAVSLVVFSLLASMTINRDSVAKDSVIKQQVNSAADVNSVPKMPSNQAKGTKTTTAPANQQQPTQQQPADNQQPKK